MGVYEFLFDRYASLFIEHDFGRILQIKKWQPGLMITHAMQMGDMQHPDRHGLEFNTLTQPYYESGLILKDLVSLNYVNIAYISFGLGVFYRYGDYSLPTPLENTAFRMMLRFRF